MIRSTTEIRGNFIKTFQTAQGPTQFSFLRKGTLIGAKYYVLAMDKGLKAHWFSIEKQGVDWMIADAAKVPKWILSVEESLREAIILHNIS